MKKRITNEAILILATAFVLLVTVFLYFQFIVPYHIYFKEQIQLFIFNSTYIGSYFSKPGGLACLIGDFLTQFLYLKGGGAVVISLLLVCEWLLIVGILNSFGLNRSAPLSALLPIIAEWMIIADITFSVAMTVAFALVLLAIYIYTRIGNKTVSVGYGIVFVPILYVLLGGSVLLFPIAVLLYEISSGKRRYFYWLLLIILLAIIPYLLRLKYLLPLDRAYFYPYWGIKGEPAVVATAVILFFASFKGIRALRMTVFSFSLSVLLILIIAIGGLTVRTNLQREKILAMATEAYFENWNEVLEIAKKSKLKNPIATYYANIALSKQRQMGDRMMEFYQPFVSGLFLPVNTESNWFVIFFSSDLYFYIGDMNMAQHSAMLGMIFSPYQRSSRLIQRLAEINLVAGDTPAAMKYIRMLDSSWFHRKKAAKLKEMALATNPDDYPWLQSKRSQIHTSDTLRSSQNPQISLELLLKSNPDNRASLDYLLAYHLLNKNIPAFFDAYSAYCKGKNDYVPEAYAEALLIYFAAFKAKPEEIAEYRINPEFIKNFYEYTRLYERSNGNLELLQEKFPHSYWLFYHFATIKT